MSNSDQPAKNDGDGCLACLAWLPLFALIGWLGFLAAGCAVEIWCDREDLRRRHNDMAAQIETIRNGEVDCLVAPDPEFVDEVLADRGCADGVRHLYLGGDLSDPRLARLRELPNLRAVILLSAKNGDAFLQHIQGLPGIEAVSLEHTYISSQGIDCIGSLPNLKLLCFAVYRPRTADLAGIKNHPSIEKLALTVGDCDESLLPLLKSLPRLRSLTIRIAHATEKDEAFRESLHQALPGCKCIVQEDER